MNVLIVDDSALLRGILKSVLQQHKEIVVVGEASNGQMAIELNQKLKPDLIVMDFNMPVLNGAQATEKIMSDSPVPILIFSNENEKLLFTALQKGAAEVMRKPNIDQLNQPQFYRQFIEKLTALGKNTSKPGSITQRISERMYNLPEAEERMAQYKMIVMGASTGGPLAVSKLLGQLPTNLPVGIVFVQHLESGFEQNYAQWLQSCIALPVRIAKDCDVVSPGEVVMAPTDRHLLFSGERLRLDDGPEVMNQKPSVNLLFKSAAKVYGCGLIGVLLTGMGSDGAEGCLEIKKNGGYTIVQDQQSSTIFGMPKSAIALGAACKVSALDQIPFLLLRLLDTKK